MRKKILSIFLVLCMVVTLLPVGAFADSTPTSGKCGDNLTWRTMIILTIMMFHGRIF